MWMGNSQQGFLYAAISSVLVNSIHFFHHGFDYSVTTIRGDLVQPNLMRWYMLLWTAWARMCLKKNIFSSQSKEKELHYPQSQSVTAVTVNGGASVKTISRISTEKCSQAFTSHTWPSLHPAHTYRFLRRYTNHLQLVQTRTGLANPNPAKVI